MPTAIGTSTSCFAEQAARRPDAAAVIAGRTRVSYRELDSSANRLAHHLGEAGRRPGGG